VRGFQVGEETPVRFDGHTGRENPYRLSQRQSKPDCDGEGFRSLTEECSDYTSRVEGTIPGWLSGTLVRNGPGRFEAGGA
jgi:carotenoid cleavage dioxygenase-like enzyme